MPSCILTRVPHEKVCAGTRVSKKRVIHVTLKSWLKPLGPRVPYLEINLISCFLWYSWLATLASNTTCPLVYDWFGWSGHVQEGHSFRWWHLTVLSKAVCQPASSLPSFHCWWAFFHYIVILHGTMVDILESMILFCLLVLPVLSKQIHPHLIFHV